MGDRHLRGFLTALACSLILSLLDACVASRHPQCFQALQKASSVCHLSVEVEVSGVIDQLMQKDESIYVPAATLHATQEVEAKLYLLFLPAFFLHSHSLIDREDGS